MSIRKTLYQQYYQGGLVHFIHERAIRSPLVVRLMFGVKIHKTVEVQADFFDLTTWNMSRILPGLLEGNRQAKICEIGVGAYAILSRALTRHVDVPIVTGDIDQAFVDAAIEEVATAGAPIEVVLSETFDGFEEGRFDLVFWNIPYQEPSETYLPKFFQELPERLTPGGKAVIGFNTETLPREEVMEILSRTPALEQRTLRTASWNLHEILVLGLKDS